MLRSRGVEFKPYAWLVAIRRMSRYRVAPPVWRAAAVVEAQSGAFARWGLAVGDRLEFK